MPYLVSDSTGRCSTVSRGLVGPCNGSEPSANWSAHESAGRADAVREPGECIKSLRPSLLDGQFALLWLLANEHRPHRVDASWQHDLLEVECHLGGAAVPVHDLFVLGLGDGY